MFGGHEHFVEQFQKSWLHVPENVVHRNAFEKILFTEKLAKFCDFFISWPKLWHVWNQTISSNCHFETVFGKMWTIRFSVWYYSICTLVCYHSTSTVILNRTFTYIPSFCFSYGLFVRCGSGSGEIWLDDVRCVGNESALTECPNRGWGNHNCRHHEDSACRCYYGNGPDVTHCNSTSR